MTNPIIEQLIVDVEAKLEEWMLVSGSKYKEYAAEQEIKRLGMLLEVLKLKPGGLMVYAMTHLATSTEMLKNLDADDLS